MRNQEPQDVHLVGYAVPMYSSPAKSQKVDFTVPMAVAISVTVCFCPILGLAALIIAVCGMTQEPSSNTPRIRMASLYVSLAGYLCGILLMGIILIVSFAHKGSEIYIKPPGEEYSKYWISGA